MYVNAWGPSEALVHGHEPLAYDGRMLFLVDGYNVTHRDPATRSVSLAEQRDALVSRLRVRGRGLLGVGRIVVVFDGQRGPGLSAGEGSPVEVVYAHERSADDEIVRIVAAADRSSGAIVVVSADGEVAERVKAHGGASVEVRDPSVCFEDAGRGRARRNSRGAVARDAGLPRGANAITRELKELWLEHDE